MQRTSKRRSGVGTKTISHLSKEKEYKSINTIRSMITVDMITTQEVEIGTTTKAMIGSLRRALCLLKGMRLVTNSQVYRKEGLN